MEIDNYTRRRMGLGSGVWTRIDEGISGGSECFDPKVTAREESRARASAIKAAPRIDSAEGQAVLAKIAAAVNDGFLTKAQAEGLVAKLFPAE